MENERVNIKKKAKGLTLQHIRTAKLILDELDTRPRIGYDFQNRQFVYIKKNEPD